MYHKKQQHFVNYIKGVPKFIKQTKYVKAGQKAVKQNTHNTKS